MKHLLASIALFLIAACSVPAQPAQTVAVDKQCISVADSIAYNQGKGWQIAVLSAKQLKTALDLIDTGATPPDQGFAAIKGDNYIVLFSQKGCFLGAAKIDGDAMQHILGEGI